MKTEKILLAVTLPAAVALTRLRMVNFSGSLPAANDFVLGVANADYAEGEQAGVNVQGEILVETGGAIDVGAFVASDAQGRAVVYSAELTSVPFGISRDAASGAGDIVRVVRVAIMG